MTIGEKGRDEIGQGDTVLGSKGSGTEGLGTKGLKDRDPRVGGNARLGLTHSSCNGTRSAQAGKTRLEGTARPERSDTLSGIGRLDRERSLGSRTRPKEQMTEKVRQNDRLD